MPMMPRQSQRERLAAVRQAREGLAVLLGHPQVHTSVHLVGNQYSATSGSEAVSTRYTTDTGLNTGVPAGISDKNFPAKFAPQGRDNRTADAVDFGGRPTCRLKPLNSQSNTPHWHGDGREDGV